MTEFRQGTFSRLELSRWVRLLFALGCLTLPSALAQSGERDHYATNLKGDFVAANEVGFNLADIGSPSLLDNLPGNMRGVLWLGNGYNTECAWRLTDQVVADAVAAVRGHPKFSGIYYISDEPHPTNCPDAAEKVAERTALIHSLDPEGRTFIVVQNGANDPTEFEKLRNSADYIGLVPYPCNVKNAEKGCDLGALRSRIKAALSAGIEPHRIVPVYQAFGQDCIEGSSPYYRLPSPEEVKAMLSVWDELVPPRQRPFDMTYSWGPQPRSACPTLKMADGVEHPDLISVFADYFAGTLIHRTANE